MPWIVLEHPDFARERAELDDDVSDKLDEVILALEEGGAYTADGRFDEWLEARDED